MHWFGNRRPAQAPVLGGRFYWKSNTDPFVSFCPTRFSPVHRLWHLQSYLSSICLYPVCLCILSYEVSMFPSVFSLWWALCSSCHTVLYCVQSTRSLFPAWHGVVAAHCGFNAPIYHSEPSLMQKYCPSQPQQLLCRLSPCWAVMEQTRLGRTLFTDGENVWVAEPFSIKRMTSQAGLSKMIKKSGSQHVCEVSRRVDTG